MLGTKSHTGIRQVALLWSAKEQAKLRKLRIPQRKNCRLSAWRGGTGSTTMCHRKCRFSTRTNPQETRIVPIFPEKISRKLGHAPLFQHVPIICPVPSGFSPGFSVPWLWLHASGTKSQVLASNFWGLVRVSASNLN